ncbi:MAG: ACT domain-containing protein [Cocleimonas sp.]
MSGETNLNKLLSSMSPKLLDDEYVFCSVENGQYGDFIDLSPLATYMEAEGLTLVITKDNADKSELEYESVFKCITLLIHSSLEAVGLTAAVSTKLAENGISANVVAAYYHDHIFVQSVKAELALEALHDFNS